MTKHIYSAPRFASSPFVPRLASSSLAVSLSTTPSYELTSVRVRVRVAVVVVKGRDKEGTMEATEPTEPTLPYADWSVTYD